MSPLAIVATAMLGSAGLAVGVGLIAARWAFRRVLFQMVARVRDGESCPVCGRSVDRERPPDGAAPH